MDFKKSLALLETTLSNIAGLGIAIMAVAVTVNVIARYGFRAPFTGIYALTENYLLVLIAYFALAHTERDGLHIRITMVVKWLPSNLRRLIYCVANLLTAAYFSLLTWQGWDLARGAWQRHEISSGTIPWPLYLGYVLVPIGTALIVVRLLYDCVPSRQSARLTELP